MQNLVTQSVSQLSNFSNSKASGTCECYYHFTANESVEMNTASYFVDMF